jgi:hypothetical protein
MRAPDSTELVCVNCDWRSGTAGCPAEPPPPLPASRGGAPAPAPALEEVDAAPAPLRERLEAMYGARRSVGGQERHAASDTASQEIADRLLRGYTMLEHHCPRCEQHCLTSSGPLHSD